MAQLSAPPDVMDGVLDQGLGKTEEFFEQLLKAELAERRVGELPSEAARRAAIDIAAATLAEGEGETAAHSDDVDVIADGICRLFGLDQAERDDVLAAARLHDLGKLAIPAQVLEKPGPLSDKEWAVMRHHTISGERILAAVPELSDVATLVRHSHERWDGLGYPDGLADEEIPLGSRIVACADAFHAVRSDRPYRRGRSAADALAEVCAHAGTQFDPDVTDALELLSLEMRAEDGGGTARRTSYRSTRLAALLLTLAFGVGGSAIAKFGLPSESGAEASEPSTLVAPASPRVPFALPSLDDLPDFTRARGRNAPGPARDANRRSNAGLISGLGDGSTRRPRPDPVAGNEIRPGSSGTSQVGGGSSTPSSEGGGPGGGGPGNGVSGVGQGVSGQGSGGGVQGGSSQQPGGGGPGNGSSAPSGSGNGSPSNGSPGVGSPGSPGLNPGPGNQSHAPPVTSAPTPLPVPDAPGQGPGRNPGHGGLPPGNPNAPGHILEGTPGHGGTPPGHGGIAPGQAMP